MASPAKQAANHEGHGQVSRQKTPPPQRISNRHTPELEIDLSYTKQRSIQFLIANFGSLFAFSALSAEAIPAIEIVAEGRQ